MKFIINTVIGVLFAIMAISVPALAGPKLTIPEQEFDFGYVPQGAKIAHEFWLYSTGDDTLKILKVSPG